MSRDDLNQKSHLRWSEPWEAVFFELWRQEERQWRSTELEQSEDIEGTVCGWRKCSVCGFELDDDEEPTIALVVRIKGGIPLFQEPQVFCWFCMNTRKELHEGFTIKLDGFEWYPHLKLVDRVYELCTAGAHKTPWCWACGDPIRGDRLVTVVHVPDDTVNTQINFYHLTCEVNQEFSLYHEPYVPSPEPIREPKPVGLMKRGHLTPASGKTSVVRCLDSRDDPPPEPTQEQISRERAREFIRTPDYQRLTYFERRVLFLWAEGKSENTGDDVTKEEIARTMHKRFARVAEAIDTYAPWWDEELTKELEAPTPTPAEAEDLAIKKLHDYLHNKLGPAAAVKFAAQSREDQLNELRRRRNQGYSG